ncbi:hypothetical protein CQW23_33779 [Capsicum baccatum]|uniref:Uncharacterized protein n=1 Tax=Capsicum baccatum TaxID=33114 RepID=A0A2G2V0W4_CAPBA|nr:hypothetical protein CQW23_33779 [Capsicum baccatum]
MQKAFHIGVPLLYCPKSSTSSKAHFLISYCFCASGLLMANNEAKMNKNGGSKAAKTINEINSKKRKLILERSVAWDHFDKIDGPNGELIAKYKVFTIMADNGSSNNMAVKELSKQFSKWRTNMMDGNHLHMGCMAHILNLVVQEGLKEMNDSVKCVRQVVRYIRQSPARLKKFKECSELEKIACKKSLCLDVPTRWNFTYLMLNVEQEFDYAFVSYGARDCGLLHYLLTNT